MTTEVYPTTSRSTVEAIESLTANGQGVGSGLLERRLPGLSGLLAIPGFVGLSLSNGIVHSFSMRMHAMIIAWLVLEMTGSKLWLGIVTGVPAISVVAFALLGGVLADSRDPRRTLIVSRCLLATVSFLAAVLATNGQLPVGVLMVCVLANVSLMAADMPVSRVFLTQVVGNSRLISAGAANLVAVNLFSIAGPLALGVLIGKAGAPWALFVLSGGYLAAMLLMLRQPARAAARNVRGAHPLADLTAGFDYLRSAPVVAAFVRLGFMVSVAGIYFGMVPVYAREVLHVGPEGLGLLTASFSAGSMAGALYMTANGNLRHRGRLMLMLSLMFSVLMLGFAVSQSFWLSCFFSLSMGLVSAFWQNTLSALIQVTAAPEMRGRAVAVFTMGYQLANLGWLVGGVLATLLSVEATVILAALAFGGFSTWVLSRTREALAID